MSEVVQYYLLDRLEKAVKDLKEDMKESFKSRKQDNELIIEGPSGLTIVVSDVSGKKSFDSKKAEEILSKHLPPYEFFNHFVRIMATPIKPIPPTLLDALKEYFVIEEFIDATEEKVKASSLPDELVAKCYTQGNPTVKLTAPTKMSNRELKGLADQLNIKLIPDLGD